MTEQPKSGSGGILKALGPGLLLASSAIGTSHLVLSTRAGAHYGMIFFWVILLTLFFKYPFYEFGPRYANATGHSLLYAYKQQGKWAVILFMLVIFINMFAVTGAISAVCGGLLSTMMGMGNIPMPALVGGVMIITALILLIGRYQALDVFIKLITVVLLVTVLIAFVAVLIKGPAPQQEDFRPGSILEGAGLALLISLMGWMPSGMEASTMHSIWTVEKIRSSGYRPTLKEGLFDFNLGYLLITLVALMFLIIGVFTVYGSGRLLDSDNSTQFSNQLLQVFTTNLGSWSRPVIALAAFGTIYGTLIAVWDAFGRSWARCLQAFKFEEISEGEDQQIFLSRMYNIFLPLIGLGGFILFIRFGTSMIAILQTATIVSFITAPVISVLNLRAITGPSIGTGLRPPPWMLRVAYAGIFFMIGFSVYYLWDLIR